MKTGDKKGRSAGCTPLSGQEHGGNIHKLLREMSNTGELLDFSANINPLGPPAWLRSHVNRQLAMIAHYPDPECRELIRTIGERYRVDERLVVAANGTTELLHLLPYIIEPRPVIIPVPSYIDYQRVFTGAGFAVQTVMLDESDGFKITGERLAGWLRGGEIVIFGNPVNPAGSVLADTEIRAAAEAFPDTLFIIDEAFHDFTADFQTVGGSTDNIITLNSLTKFFALPGLRVGFGILPRRYAERMRQSLPPWSVNTLAQSVAAEALCDDDYCRSTRSTCRRLREELAGSLARISGLKVYDSAANYLLLRCTAEPDGEELYTRLLAQGIVIRRCSNYQGLDRTYLRVAVRTGEENRQLVEALQDAFASQVMFVSSRVTKQARALMFQGTSSNAGKSIMTAAFCRILLQEGLRVAPFKAQNMSLNSHVTRDGGEMGRAQVVQAMAARVDPDWRMNPVLLKPNSDTGSQVIINGRPVGTMNVREYHQYKEQAWAAARQSYHELAADYDVIVLEGAGSPGEVNLKRHDFVNMKMAREARSPVLLVGDIDRGGVYASFAGIMDVLEEWERRLIAGFIVNKFRGDQSLLDDAHRFIERHTGRPVYGVVPYISGMAIPQEDSVALREGCYGRQAATADQVDIAVIDLPHISNYTDIDALHGEPDVAIRFVSQAADLGRPDAVILPGSKNVAGDLAALARAGFVEALHGYAAAGGILVGICGGYQMLGETIRDPHRLETNNEAVAGLGLLAGTSVLQSGKILRRRTGTHLLANLPVSGYEIHHGVTENHLKPVLSFPDGSKCGGSDDTGRIWGVYLHGLFDEDLFRRWFVDRLRLAKGLPAMNRVLAPYDLDKNLDELAATVRSCFSLEHIYRLIGL
jgi:cobyric acid synthase CobQ/L-threonine-O-3-phosphate decarboxylase